MNLFFVHTPFQLLVAQNIVVSERLENNLLVLSYTSEKTSHFYDVFDLIVVPTLWKETFKIGKLNVIVSPALSPLRHYRDVKRFLDRIGQIVAQYAVKSFYFGDINHFSYVLLAERFKSDVAINFFEEGLSHYITTVNKKRYGSTAINRLKQIFSDLLIFNRLGAPGFSKYVYATRDSAFGFVIRKKYSSFNVALSSYDYFLKLKIVESEKLSRVLENERQNAHRRQGLKSVLFLSTTATSLFNDPINDELLALRSFFADKTDQYFLLLKYHPKDTAEKKERLRKFFRENNITFYEIFDGASLPIEVLFTKIPIDIIISYISSSMLYAQVMDERLEVYSLLPAVLKDYERRNVRNEWVEKIWRQFNDVHRNLLSRPVMDSDLR